MRNRQTKEEQVYKAVKNGNQSAVKALHQEGASLEWVDKEGQTPLILACTRGDLFEMVLTLLTLGANLSAYQPGTHGGMPLHHAAKRGLEKTVRILLDNGADPLAVNDDGLTPYRYAIACGHTSVVRLIELGWALGWKSHTAAVVAGEGLEWRETLHGSHAAGFCNVRKTVEDMFACPSQSFRSLVRLPRTIISLANAEVEELKFSSADPVLVITDIKTKTKYRFLSKKMGDKGQLERLYKACRGKPSDRAVATGVPVQGMQTHFGLWVEYPRSPQLSEAGAQLAELQHRRHGESSDSRTRMSSPKDAAAKSGGWRVDEKQQSAYNGWFSSNEEAGPSRVQDFCGKQPKQPDPESRVKAENSPLTEVPASDVPLPAPPSAPSLPADYAALQNSDDVGAIHYPPINTSPGELEFAAVAPQNERAAAATSSPEGASQCVVCWDAPAEGVCIPCGHLAGCMSCLSETKAKNWGCPVCRAPLEQVIRVYAV